MFACCHAGLSSYGALIVLAEKVVKGFAHGLLLGHAFHGANDFQCDNRLRVKIASQGFLARSRSARRCRVIAGRGKLGRWRLRLRGLLVPQSCEAGLSIAHALLSPFSWFVDMFASLHVHL